MIRVFLPIFFLVSIQCAHALELSAYRDENGIKTSLSDIHYSLKPVKYGFTLTSEEAFWGKLVYLINDQKTTEVTISVHRGEKLIFPNEQDFVYLDKQGHHRFELIQANNLISSRSIIIKKHGDNNSVATNLKGLKSKSIQNKIAQKLDYQRHVDIKKIKFESFRNAGSKVYKSLADSVVLIVADEGIGTGSIIKPSGIIITNWHVIQGKRWVNVVFKPKGFDALETAENYIGEVIKINKKFDLALIKINTKRDEFKTIPLASVDEIMVASDVHAIGHPKGQFWTYTKGVISQMRPNYSWKTSDNVTHAADVIQTQTPINPGNSGGPLINDGGDMVGVNSFVDSGADGLNYAVAITTVQDFLKNPGDELGKRERVSKQKVAPHVVDRNNDNRTDFWFFDDNENGVFDRWEIDDDFDGTVDRIFYDVNENEIAEMTINYLEYDGSKIAIIEFDDNEDGSADQIGYDFDFDGELDKIEPA